MRQKRNVLVSLLSILTILIIQTPSVHAFAHVNFIAPDDSLIRSLAQRPLHEHRKSRWLIEALVESGRSHTSKNIDGSKVNLLQIYDATQSLIAAFINPITPSTQNFIQNNPVLRQLRDQLILADGRRGELVFSGRFSGTQALVHASYEHAFNSIPGRFSAGFVLPIKTLEVKGLSITPLSTTALLRDDVVVQQLYTPLSSLFTLMNNAGNLNISNWKDSNIGDLILLVGWSEQLPTHTLEAIETLSFFLETGLLFPTAPKKNIAQALALSFGNDKAWGIPLRMGFEINFMLPIRVGASADILFSLKKTQTYRLKTFPFQTEFLLLNTGCAKKKTGTTWRCNFYGQISELVGNLALRVAYQYEQHNADRLISPDTAFASDAGDLQGWHHHNLLFEASMPLKPIQERVDYIPELAFFYKVGFGGKKVIDMNTLGGRLSVLF